MYLTNNVRTYYNLNMYSIGVYIERTIYFKLQSKPFEGFKHYNTIKPFDDFKHYNIIKPFDDFKHYNTIKPYGNLGKKYIIPYSNMGEFYKNNNWG